MSKRTYTEKQVLVLLQALEFYANPEQYHAISFLFDPPCGGFKGDFGGEKEHQHWGYNRKMPGKTARKAIRRFAKMTKQMPNL